MVYSKDHGVGGGGWAGVLWRNNSHFKNSTRLVGVYMYISLLELE